MIAAEPTILDHFEDVRQTGTSRYMARCPAHEDRSPSLSIALADDGRTLLHDFAGCAVEDVLAALGLGWSALFPDGPQAPMGARPKSWTRPKKKPAPPLDPVNVILTALSVAGLDWRATPSPDMWVIAECPRCLAPDVWMFARWVAHWEESPSEPPRFSCPGAGCSRDEILEALETSAAITEAGL